MTNVEQYKKIINILTKLSETVTIPSAKNELNNLSERYSLLIENSKMYESSLCHASAILDGPITPPKGMASNGNSINSNSAKDLL